MAITTDPNIELLMLAASKLGELADEMVFLGGCVIGLLITDTAAPEIRPTDDVDAIVSVTTLTDYYALSERLRQKGFAEDTSEDAPVCRWQCDRVVLDVMPVEEKVLGFGNKWYKPAMETANTITIADGIDIRIATLPYFLITKLEAFDGRGGGDYLLSHDIEDFIAVVDGRAEVVEEVKQSDGELRQALSARISNLLIDPRFVTAISGHMPTDETSQARVKVVMDRLSRLAVIH